MVLKGNSEEPSGVRVQGQNRTILFGDYASIVLKGNGEVPSDRIVLSGDYSSIVLKGNSKGKGNF